jgi:hypothetical protein
MGYSWKIIRIVLPLNLVLKRIRVGSIGCQEALSPCLKRIIYAFSELSGFVILVFAPCDRVLICREGLEA